jgi:cyanosortase A-associated protein
MKLETLWTSIWRLLLLTSFSSVCFALATVVLRPAATRAAAEPFIFPDQLPLSEWQLSEVETLEGPGPRQQGVLYRYVQSEKRLEVELWYGGNGNVCRRLLQQELAAASEQAQTASVYETASGPYKYSTRSGESYLQSVIDSRGGSLVSYDQFVRNRYQYFLRPQSMIRWLTGEESFVGDHDCLSTELLLTASPDVAVDSQASLESAWQDLSRWGYAQLNSKS